MNKPVLRKKWKGTMTQRERFNAQMNYESYDRSVNMEFGFWEENFTEWPLFADNGITNMRDADVALGFDFHDGLGGKTWINPYPTAREIEVRGDTRIIMNGDGVIAEVPVDGHDTIPHFVKPTIVTPDDWKKVKEEKLRVDDPDRIVDIEALKKRFPTDRDYPICVSAGSMIGKIRDMLTFEGLAYACFDYPEMVEEMVETCCQLSEHFLDQVLGKIDFDYASGWEDIAFKSGPIVSMDFWTNVVVPRFKRLGDKIHGAGIKVWYTDCDGDVRPLIPGMMEAGINCLFPLEVNCSGHPGPILEEYGKDLRLMGGVDKLQLRAGKEAIKSYLESLAPYVERGGFIPHCDHRCPPDVNPDDYIYYLDLKEEMWGLK